MPVAAVQRLAKGAVATSVSIGSGDGWATPTAGNLLVISANSDALVTLNAPTGTTAGPSVIDGNGTYSWYRIAAGTETTITASPSVSDDIALTVCEYSGAGLPADGSNSSTNAGSPGGTTTTSTSVTTLATGALIVTFALIHTRNTVVATGPAWTNSFVNVLDTNSGGSSVTTCQTFVGELLGAGAAGSYSTACSWTNGYSDRQQIILAFPATAAPATGLPILVMPPRR